MEYPYLAFKVIDDKLNVVFFTSEDKGVVVHDETGKDDLKFGRNGEFNEDEYTVLPKVDKENGEEIVITLKN